MNEKYRKLLNYLYEHKGWIAANELSEHLAVTTRSIQNYVKEINRLCHEQVILSSYRGYCINKQLQNSYQLLLAKSEETEKKARTAVLLSRILTVPNIDFFNLADEMYISESLVNIELKKAERLLKKYHLTLVRSRNKLEITGSETDKRSLMAQLIQEESNLQLGNLLQDQAFSSTYLSFGSIDHELLRQIRSILCSAEHIHFNDFGIQNILIYILIMIERINDRLLLPPNQNMADNRDIHPAYRMAETIVNLLSERLTLNVPASEIDYLSLLISSNTTQIEIGEEDFYSPKYLIPSAYQETVKELILSLEDNYFLPKFNDDFIVRFTLHIMNWITRSKQGITIKNSLTDEVKKSYPLIYDMALYVAKLLSRQYELTIDDDECSFLVYHIGSYLLLHRSSKLRVNIQVIYLNYNNIHLNALHLLEHRFQDTASFFLTPLSDFTADLPEEADLTLTMGNFELNTDRPVLHFNLLPTPQNLSELEHLIQKLLKGKKQALLRQHFSRYIREDLFDFNLYTEDEFQMIRIMSEHCAKRNLCDHAFQASVMERELLSSTSFIDGIAIPHSLEHNCREPFFYVVINERPMKWGEHQVQLILLIGTSLHDIKAFGEIFDGLIKVLSEDNTLPKLLKCKNYNQFIDTIAELVIELED